MKLGKNKKSILILALILMEITSIVLMYKSSNNRETILDNVNLKVETKKMKGIAIMLEQDDGSYIESASTSFPTDMEFNSELSGCIDNLGNKIEDSLTFENGVANVITSNTSYCYLYFDELVITTENLNEYVGDDLWESTLEDDGYRYIGTDPDNYICFGTIDTSTCTGNTDLYMYRIIGIFEDSSGNKHLKLIKKEALNTAYAWQAYNSIDTDWDASALYKGINGSYFLTNTTYSYMQDTNWTNKIADWDYTATNTLSYENYSENSIYGPNYYDTTPVSSIYLHEMNKSGKSSATCYYDSSATADCSVGEWKTVSSKIGLMYASDYNLSLGSSSLNYTNNSNYSTLITGWMHLSNNDSTSLSTTLEDPPSTPEWTMSRDGVDSNGNYSAWRVGSTGSVYSYYALFKYSVRPVFYLTSDVTINGEGTIDNPYLITN